jgi:hypothetical protein
MLQVSLLSHSSPVTAPIFDLFSKQIREFSFIKSYKSQQLTSGFSGANIEIASAQLCGEGWKTP